MSDDVSRAALSAGFASAAQAQINGGACWCNQCIKASNRLAWHMVVCPDCGNKRCPKANDHRNACTNSNDTGQPGSAYA